MKEALATVALIAVILLGSAVMTFAVVLGIQFGMRPGRRLCPRCGDPIGPDQVRGDICHSCLAKWPWPS